MKATTTPTTGLWRDDKHRYFWAETPGEVIGPMTSVTTAMKSLVQDWMGPWSKRETAAAAVRHHALVSEHLAKHRLPDALCPVCTGTKEWQGPDLAATNWLKSIPGYQKDIAADLGTRVHMLAEAITFGAIPDMEDDVRPYVDAYLRFLDERQPEFIRVEAMVCNLTHRYAGTLDFIARIDGILMLVDIKTSKSGVYPETALQLAGLGFAEFMAWAEDTRKHPIPPIDQYVVLHVQPHLYQDTGYRLIPYDVNQSTFERFLDAKKLWEWMQGDAKKVMGQPIEKSEWRVAA
jgi:hypothetical protein